MDDRGIVKLYEDEPDKIIINNLTDKKLEEVMPYIMFVIDNKEWSIDPKARAYQSNYWRDKGIEVQACINPPRKNGLISVTIKVLTIPVTTTNKPTE